MGPPQKPNPSLKSPSPSNPGAGETFTAHPGEKLYTDAPNTIATLAPELDGLTGIRVSTRQSDPIHFTLSAPAQILVGFFKSDSKKALNVSPATEQWNILLPNAVTEAKGLPITVWTKPLPAGRNDLDLGKGAYIVLGFIPEEPPRNPPHQLLHHRHQRPAPQPRLALRKLEAPFTPSFRAQRGTSVFRLCRCLLLPYHPFMEQGGYVYVLASKGKRLYIGVTSELLIRVNEHKTRKHPGSHTARYNIDQLVYFEAFGRIEDAITRETELKGWTRIKKIQLIVSVNPTWQDLSQNWGKPAPRFDESSMRPPTTF